MMVENVLKTTFDLIFITRINNNLFKLKNSADHALFKNLYGHYGIFRIKNSNLDVTSLTTIKIQLEPEFNVFPFKENIKMPPIPIINGFQGYSGMTKNLVWKSDFEKLIEKYQKNPNPKNFLNLIDLQFLDAAINQNIIITDKTLAELTPRQNALLILLSKIDVPLKKEIYLTAWQFFEPQKFDTDYRLLSLKKSERAFSTINDLEFDFGPVISAYKSVIQEFCLNEGSKINQELYLADSIGDVIPRISSPFQVKPFTKKDLTD